MDTLVDTYGASTPVINKASMNNCRHVLCENMLPIIWGIYIAAEITRSYRKSYI